MPIFTESYLNDLIDETEQQLSQEISCIFQRFSIAVTTGVSTYTLSPVPVGILEITWKGRTIYPYDPEDWQGDPYVKPQVQGVQGQPKWYNRVSYGWDKIFFYPIPNETIAADDTNLSTDTGIASRVIVSCYRLADPNSDSIRMPTYLFRNIMKYRAMERAYLREGPNQNLQASEYFKKKYDGFLKNYTSFINKIPQAVQLGFGGEAKSAFGRKPHRPILPTSGKWSIS